MNQIYLLTDKLFRYVGWGWENGGWWFVGGGISCLLFLCLGIYRSPYR